MYNSCVFEGARVELGEAPYHHCTFRRCLIVIDGRPSILDGCTFDDCSWAFEGAAGNGIAMLKYLCQNDPRMAASVAADFGFRSGGATKH